VVLAAEHPARQPMNEKSPLTTTKDHAMACGPTTSDSSRVVRAVATLCEAEDTEIKRPGARAGESCVVNVLSLPLLLRAGRGSKC